MCVCTEAATWLCAHGASVHAQKNDGWHDTALHYAASKGHMAVAELLLAFGADAAALNFAGEGTVRVLQVHLPTAACLEQQGTTSGRCKKRSANSSTIVSKGCICSIGVVPVLLLQRDLKCSRPYSAWQQKHSRIALHSQPQHPALSCKQNHSLYHHTGHV
jgi:hypothetical protein